MPRVPPGLRIGPGQQEDPVGPVRHRGPGLLPVDDPLSRRPVRPGWPVTRGPTRRPARRSPGTTGPRRTGCAAGTWPLLRRAPPEQRAAEHLDAEQVGVLAVRDAGPGQLLDQHHLVQPGQPAPAVLLRPGDAEQARGGTATCRHRAANRSASSAVGDGPDARPAGRQLLGQHRPHLRAEGLHLGGIADVHAGSRCCSGRGGVWKASPPLAGWRLNSITGKLLLLIALTSSTHPEECHGRPGRLRRLHPVPPAGAQPDRGRSLGSGGGHGHPVGGRV